MFLPALTVFADFEMRHPCPCAASFLTFFLIVKSYFLMIQLMSVVLNVICIVHFAMAAPPASHVDLLIIGPGDQHDGLGKIAPWLVENLGDALSIVHLQEATHTQDLSADVLLYTHTLAHDQMLDDLPEATITIAYSVFESSKLPKSWVKKLNKYFDCVIVADQYLLEVYDACDVTIPIFVLPHGFYLEEFMQVLVKQRSPGQPFLFGMCGTFVHPRKNHMLVLEAFMKAFAHDPAVHLKIHTRGPDNAAFKEFMARVHEHGLSNVSISHDDLSSKAYREFLRELDCYVLLSSGEGYSLTPREALALGIPVIISDNTAHRTIINSGCVYGVPCDDHHRAYYPLSGLPVGYQSRPFVQAAQQALCEVYRHYDFYVQRAARARPWLEQYCAQALVPQFLSLFKPKHVYHGEQDVITHDAVTTRSTLLYQKYLKMMKRERL